MLFIILRSPDLAPKIVDKNTWMVFLRDNLPPQDFVVVQPNETRMFWDKFRGRVLELHDEIKLISQEYLYQVAKLNRSKHQATFRKWASSKPKFQNAAEHPVLKAVVKDTKYEYEYNKKKIQW